MKKILLLFLSIYFTSSIYPQKIESVFSNELKKPVATNYGIVFTVTGRSSLYIERNGKAVLLNSSPGCGNYYSVSYDKNTVGFKYIDGDGNQTPAVIDLSTGSVRYLHSPVKHAGQVSFVGSSTAAYTIGNYLVVGSPDGEKKYDLETYSNIAPISPNARYVAFNNDSDQIFILNLADGRRQKITNDSCGYFNPVWSPDASKLLYSTLSGTLMVYESGTGRIYNLGECFSPSWSNDSRNIIFYREEIKNQEVVNSDIYISSYNGSTERKLTSTAGVLESDPSFGINNSQIVYSIMGSEKIMQSTLSLQNFSLSNERPFDFNISPVKLPAITSMKKVSDVDTLDIPYINQLYDTPDYFNGSAACAPTSAMMVLAYYNILPQWNIRCSWPYPGHYSPWGRYISDEYRFRQINYSMQANDPNGKPFGGGYGYMWVGSNSPYSRMVSYFNNHGVSASRTDAPAYDMALNEVNAGRPYIVCVGLTSAGHVVVAHGTASTAHTLIFNDPYGNKNIGYSNYYGKNVKYDWPGYNNGYQNLNTVYWSVAVNYKPPVISDTLIDDLDFGNGFYLNNKAPASMSVWKDLNQGYNGHMWYSFTTDSSNIDSCYAIWSPSLPQDGYYEVSAYIPYSQAQSAEYKINTAGGIETVTINQSAYKDTWVSLGRFKFEKGNSGFVRLDDESSIKGQAIIFDAVKWSYIDSTAAAISEEAGITPAGFILEQNYPNPFNPSSSIKYGISKSGFVSLKVYDLLGRQVALLVNKEQLPGIYSVNFNARSLPSGIYFYELRSGGFSSIKKMILQK